MSAVLLDTTVASLLHPRRRGSPMRLLYERHMQGRTLALSFQTHAELWAWAEESLWGDAQQAGLEAFRRQFVIVPFTSELGRTWAKVMTQAKRSGRRLEAGDGWIAASAVLYGVPLLTHDKDFVGLRVDGLEVICDAP